MLRKAISIFISLFILAGAMAPVYAKEMYKMEYSSNAAMKKELKTEKKQERMDNKVDNLQTRADKEITRRISALQELIPKLNEMKKISADQKSSLTSQIQIQIENLKVQQTKIKADTDPAILKSDAQAISQSYRIYALFIPKIHILSAADRIDTIADYFTTAFDTLQTKITEAHGNGVDTTGADAALTDAKSKVADAKLQAQNASDAVTPLTPDGFPENKTTLTNARGMIETAMKDLVAARKDVREIIKSLKETKKAAMPSAGVTQP